MDSRRRFFALLFPALLGTSQLFLFGPFAAYSGNRTEFASAFWILALPLAAILVLVTALLVLAGTGLPGWLRLRYQAALFALGLLLWVQGNLLVPDYGVLYGEPLDLGGYAWRAPYEMTLWAAGLTLALVFARAVAPVAALASQLLVALQAAALVASTVVPGGQDVEPDEDRWRLPPPEIYQLSRDRNVIQVVLDGFLSDVFLDLLSREGDRFERAFEGFTFFADHLGAFPSTRTSMPAMWTGAVYRNEMPLTTFVREARERSVFSAVAGHGYRVHSVSSDSMDHPLPSAPGEIVRYRIPKPYGSYREFIEAGAAQLLDLSLFRHVPHGFKSRVYNREAWLVQRWYSGLRQADMAVRTARPSNDAAFLREFARWLTVAADRPVYMFIHVLVPHLPLVLDADCTFVGPQPRTPSRYTAQARCGLAAVQELLDRLRVLGVYDNSAIIITSDHGWQVRRRGDPQRRVRTPVGRLDKVAVSARPLLLVKPAGSSGPLQTSYAPTTITDLPATVLDLAGLPYSGFPGKPVVQVDPTSRRVRAFGYHTWRNANLSRKYLDALYVFSVDGPSRDPAAWAFRAAIFEPREEDIELEALLKAHEAGWFAIEQAPDGPFRWGDIHAVSYIPPGARAFSIRARRAPGVSQTLTVRVDGRVIARHALEDDDWRVVRHELPVRPRSSGSSLRRQIPFCLELLVDPPWRDRAGRRVGMMFGELQWTR